MLRHWTTHMSTFQLQIEITRCIIHNKVISVMVSPPPKTTSTSSRHPPHRAASSSAQPQSWSKRIRVSWAPAWRHIQSLPSFLKALWTVAEHNWAMIPNKKLGVFSGSNKLIVAINFEHQQSVASPAVLPQLWGPTKCWFRVKAKRRQWRSSPPTASPSHWQLNKNQCKLLIGSLIIDAVFTTSQGVRTEKKQGWNSVYV